MNETQAAISLELARKFYVAHELHFQRAAVTATTLERGFEYSAERFNDCDPVDRISATNERFKLRQRINRVARKGDGLQRAFSIEAGHHDKWRVVLGERFLAERPLGIMQGIGSSLHHQEQNISATRALLENAEHLSQNEKLLHLMRLDTVGLYAFNCAQLHELVLQQAFNPDLKIDLRVLRRKMSDLMRGVKVVPRRAKRRRVVTKKK